MSENTSAFRELFNMFCNEQIGRGMSRDVYDSEVVPDCVVKVETRVKCFQNILEWETWERVKETEFAKYFSPCRWISPSGVILVQTRTEKIPRNQYPKLMPYFFTDFKYDNYGMLNGQIVCHDYGTNLLFEYGMTKRMKKIKWWE